MVKARKSWRQKLVDGSKGLPRVEPITDKMSQRWGTGTVVIPAPLDVDAAMKQVPPGKVITQTELRAYFARKNNASIGCPLTTGIFAWVAAHAAEEAAEGGEKDITPYWRTLKATGELNEKYPGGLEGQAAKLKAEGHILEPGKGKKPPKVKDWEKKLYNLR